MEEREFRRIEEMMGGMMGRFRAELGQELTQLRSEIVEEFRHQIGVQREDFQHKLNLVVEGQQMLAEKLEETRSELKVDIGKIDQRVTAVAADLAAHRRDTEAHRKGWRVREKEGGE
ncbi:hypothetical protein [Geoalkalibacter subterraneus]|nr:hypothetical protein [Geoalkalibacter subterraneus]